MRTCPACLAPMGGDAAWQCQACGWRAAQADGIHILGTLDQDSSEGFSPDYFQELVRLEAGHFWFQARNNLLLWMIEKHLPPGAEFLEVGCGTGFVLQALHAHLPPLRLTGSELFLEGLSFARSRLPEVDLVQMDAKAIPYCGHFDGIGAFDVLEHVPEDLPVLEQFHKALRPGGRLFLSVPQHSWLWSVNDEYAHHHRRYEKPQLIARLDQAGFRVLRATSFVSLLLPLLILSRSRRNAKQSFDPMEEYRIPRWKQRILGLVMTIERWGIRLGVNWPLGGSLVVIAEKIPAALHPPLNS